jgi:chemotaxis signal transduction protein
MRWQEFPEGCFTLALVGYREEAHDTVVELTHNWGDHDYTLGTEFGHIALRVVIANGYGTIYGRGPEGVGSEAARYRRRYYLLFKLRELLAVEMNELREIITLPPDILRPPGVPSYIVGIHSLRGEVVTLLDARQVYGMPARSPEGDTARSKVLIFRHKDLKLGVIIDSVESIVAADFQSLIPIPRSLMGSLSADFDTDVKDFIEVADFTTRRTLKFIVLEFTRVFDRLQVA